MQILDYDYMQRWAAAFDLASVLAQATLEAGVRAIADSNYSSVSTIARAFAVAQDRDRTARPSPDIEVAEGNRHVLIRDSSAQIFSAIAKLDDREIARYDFAETVLSVSSSLQDRRE